MNTNTKKKRGKAPLIISWPDGVFTAEQVHTSVATALSRVSVHSKINTAVKTGELEVVGKSKPSIGRPKYQYRKKSEMNF
jgi:response regulator of citrate/malate metabolism